MIRQLQKQQIDLLQHTIIFRKLTKMLKNLANYRIRMRNTRQKYFTLLRKNVSIERQRIMVNFRRRLFKTIIFGSIGIAAYYYGNQLYSQHLEINKMKKKLMRIYPDQTYIISFEEDPNLLLQQVEIATTQKSQQITKLINTHCIYIKQEDNDTKQLKQKLGGTIIIFRPKGIDQLCHIIQRCKRYRHSAIVGYYPVPNNLDPSSAQLKQSLGNIMQPMKKKKYVVVDLSLFNKYQIDEINDLLQVDAGAKCRDINEKLNEKGFSPLFQDFCSDLIVHDVIINNYPLVDNQSLSNTLLNLSLVSAEGKKFKSSTQMETYGQIPNLTPLFLGTGGIFAVPAKGNFKLRRGREKSQQKSYIIQSQNLSDLVVSWRQIRNYLSSKRIQFTLATENPNRLRITTDSPISLSQYIGFQQTKKQIQKPNTNPQFIFSVNNKIVQKLILNHPINANFVVKNNLLSVENIRDAEQVRKFISDVSVQGGVLVWCKDKQLYNNIKQRIDLTQAGAELMKKIVQLRQGIDKKHVLQSHARYQKYFAKGMFRKLTEFFW